MTFHFELSFFLANVCLLSSIKQVTHDKLSETDILTLCVLYSYFTLLYSVRFQYGDLTIFISFSFKNYSINYLSSPLLNPLLLARI